MLAYANLCSAPNLLRSEFPVFYNRGETTPTSVWRNPRRLHSHGNRAHATIAWKWGFSEMTDDHSYTERFIIFRLSFKLEKYSVTNSVSQATVTVVLCGTAWVWLPWEHRREGFHCFVILKWAWFHVNWVGNVQDQNILNLRRNKTEETAKSSKVRSWNQMSNNFLSTD